MTTTETETKLIDNNSNNDDEKNKKKEEITVTKFELTFDKIDDIDEAAEYLRKVIDEHDQFQFVTKAKLIRMFAEKYKALQFPLLSIIDEICKQLGTRVTRNNVLGVLGPEYKRENRVAAGQEAALTRRDKSNKERMSTIETVEELEDTVAEPIVSGDGFRSTGGDADYEGEEDKKPKFQDEYEGEFSNKLGELKQIIEDQEKQIKALKGEIQYSQMTTFEKWRKMDKAQALTLDTVSKASISDIYVLVDIRNGEVIKIITDKEHDRMLKNKKNE